MKFLERFVRDNEKRLPRRPEDPDASYINWDDFNYPASYPIVHYNPEEVKDPERQSFITVRSIDSIYHIHTHLCLLCSLLSYKCLCILSRLFTMGRNCCSCYTSFCSYSSGFIRFP